MVSELASKIVEALNGNDHWPARVEIPHDQDIHVGPITFRFGGGPKRDRWYVAEDPRLTPREVEELRRDEEIMRKTP
jgi:hypothetical protein